MAIYDMATAIRQPDASNFGQGLLVGQQFAQGRRQNQARNALARLAQGDQTALPELMQADPDAGMKWQDMQRAEETRKGLQGFFRPAQAELTMPSGNPIDNSLKALAGGFNLAPTIEQSRPASFDAIGATNFLASRGDANALEALIKQQNPEATKFGMNPQVGINPATGKPEFFVSNERGVPKFLGVGDRPKVEVKGGFIVDPETGQLGAPLPRTPAQIAADERAEAAAARQQALLERMLRNDNKPDTLDLKERAQIEQSYRKEFNALNAAYNEIKRSRSNILSSLEQNSAAGDLAAATSLMKMLDPNSVVRESELGMAQNATGAIDRVYNYAQMLANGQRLNPQQRKEYVQLANDLFANSDNEFKTRASEYIRVAKDYGLKPENIVGTAAANPVPGWKSAGYKNVMEAHADYKRARDAAYKSGNMDIVRKIDAEARADGVIK